MYRLMTKEARQNERKAWISGRETEKYKDIEILSYTKNYDGKEKVSLIIWRGQAGKPYINYLCRTPESAQSYIDQEKKAADNRERYYKEHPKANGKVQTESAKAALMIKTILKREYPSVRFSVRSDNFANGNSVRISWVDGVPTKEIEGFARQFESGTFDGMTDCYNYDNTANHPQAKYVHCQRDVSPEKNAIIREQLAKLMNIENSDYAVVPKPYEINVRGYAYGPPLSALVYQIAIDFDFSKGFTGVRHQKTESGETISNMFELY